MSEANFPSKPVLLVDDEENFLFSASFILNADGITNTVQCQDSRKVMPLLSKQDFSAILLDIMMPHKSGKELLLEINRDYPGLPIIMSTAINEVDTAVECMKCGAFDYLVKPIDDARLISSIRRAIELSNLRNENILLKRYLLSDEVEHPEAFNEIITQNSAMRSIFQYAEAIAGTSMPVLITGETGVGKELIAKAIHTLSDRKGPFVPVNVAGVDDQLFSDTLFGHRKGAFTGANQDRKGLIEQAAGGTLFLDEIGDLSIESQVKLLRLLQEGKYLPLGADAPKHTDARIIVATNQNLDELQQMGKFRKDLYYRLQTHHIHIPPLHKRQDDIKILVDHFLNKAAKALAKKTPSPPRELYILLENYSYPGNVRELESMIFDAVSRHKSGILSMDSFKEKTSIKEEAQIPSPAIEDKSDKKGSVFFNDRLPTLKEAEQSLIDEALKRADGNQTIAAQLLGLTRRALNNRLSRRKK
jgi:DNA-binding NtrC family response regulator